MDKDKQFDNAPTFDIFILTNKLILYAGNNSCMK